MAPGCSKTDHDPANSTAVTITTSLPFQGFVSAIPSGRQKEPMYFEIWQPAMRLQYNSGFNTYLRCLAGFATLLTQPDLPPMLQPTIRHLAFHLTPFFYRQENELAQHATQQSTKGHQEKSHTFLPSGQFEPVQSSVCEISQ